MNKAWKGILVYGITAAAVLLAAYWGNRAVTVFSENSQPQWDTCIILDPGHGGEDGGAVSVSGRPESGYNLEISLRLNDLLQLLGQHTKLTRTTDTALYTQGETLAQKKVSDLKERVRLVEETENALLLSIHQNHFPDPRYSGPQVFYGNGEGSEILARHLQEALTVALDPGSSRKATKSSGVYLMQKIRCPGVLVECGFLSNPGEEEKLRDPEYQKKLCAVIAAAVCQYLSNT